MISIANTFLRLKENYKEKTFFVGQLNLLIAIRKDCAAVIKRN